MNYYNEFDPKAAQWLRALIEAGEIPYGDVDERSIADVRADELVEYTQCHFFAGIGGWPLALDIAGWPRDREVWTGSCPCQPFSVAGKKMGKKDSRHLWPVFRKLVGKRQPSVVFGEQVASKDGRTWLAGVRSNLERLGYAVGAADLCAAGVNAPHIRQRLYWVARAGRMADNAGAGARQHERGVRQGSASGGANGGVADADKAERGGSLERQKRKGGAGSPDCGGVGNAFQSRLEGQSRHGEGGDESGRIEAPACGSTAEAGDAPDRLADATSGRGAQHERESRQRCDKGPGDSAERKGSSGLADSDESELCGEPSARQQPVREQDHGSDPWSAFDLIPCTDGKHRRIEPQSFPLAYGLPRGLGVASERIRELAKVAGLDGASLRSAKSHRITQIKGYGNAIVPELAGEFVKAFLDTE